MKWAESIQYLLDDQDGYNLFKDYMDPQGLGHLLEFILAVRGFKNQLTDSNLDPDLLLKLVKTINKR